MANNTIHESDNECESRQSSYVAFMSTIPRLCSPTICGTANYKTPKRKGLVENEGNGIEGNGIENNGIEGNGIEDNGIEGNGIDLSFNWSIEQLALLNPCDFSNYEDLMAFKQIDELIVSKQLDEENQEFFSQNQIIPSPKTPLKTTNQTIEMNEQSIDSKLSPIYRIYKTPEMRHNESEDNEDMRGESLVTDSFGTPLSCSKFRQKKKLFREEHYLRESVANSSRNDSLIDSHSLFSPIYSPNWRNTSLSHRITHLSPICSKDENDSDLDIDNEKSGICETSMKTEIASYSNMTCDMLSLDSQTDRPKTHSSIYDYLDNDYEKDFQFLNNNNKYCGHRVLQRFLTKTSTPSHL
jgi:hypothetical protein